MRRDRRKTALAIGVLVLIACQSSQASAATTIGQLAPNPSEYLYSPGYGYYYVYHPPAAICQTARDVLAPSGSSYVVPTGGTTITAWRTNATIGAGQEMTFKVYRKVGEPATYEVVAHDGPRTLAPGTTSGGTVNAFTGLSIPVQPGDVVGLYPDNASSVHDACLFPSAGSYLYSDGSLGDGSSGPFTAASGYSPNLTATVALSAGGPELHTLTVVRGGSGYGTVQSSPPGIEGCASECTHGFEAGAVVTLTATPDSYSTFQGWSGACSGQGGCQVMMGSDATVTASFAGAGGEYTYGSGSYGSGGYGPSSEMGGAYGSPAPAVHRRCRKAAHRRKATKRHCAAKKRRVAKRGRSADLGKAVLETLKGRTLYSLSAERGRRFICTGECLRTWRPLLVPRRTRPLGPVKLGTITRPEGKVQVTYHRRPLYTFRGDTSPGEASGEGIKDVGTWSAVTIPREARP